MDKDVLRILLVDDDEDDYIIIRRTIDQVIHQNFVLVWKNNYEDGITELRKGEYDACLLDYRLKGGHTGLEFLEATAGRDDFQTPVIVLTGYEEYDIDIEAMERGASDFLSKNLITPSLLERSLRYCIERSHYKNKLLEARDTLEETVRKRTEALESANLHLEKEIAGRKRAEKTIIHAKVEWERTFDAITDLIAVIDREQRIVRCNSALMETIGLAYHEIIGQPCSRWFQFMGELSCSCSCENSIEFNDRELGGNFILNSSPFKDSAGEITGYVLVARNITERKKIEEEREMLISKLRDAIGEVKALSGLLPICSSCKKIRDDRGYWNQLEAYISDHSDASFSHGICPDCAKALYPEIYT